MSILDAAKSRPLEGGASFSLSNRVFRAAWMLVWALAAAWTPPPLHGWRRFLLKLFGADIAPGVRVYGRATVWYPPHLKMERFACLGPGANCYNQAPVVIGERAVISQGAHLCTGSHDIGDRNFQLVARPIEIGANAWVAAEAFVGPGVRVGEGAVLGARGVAFRNLDPWTVYAGNPAKPLKPRVFRDMAETAPAVPSD